MTGEGVNIFAILMMIVLPLALGEGTGFIGVKILKKECGRLQTILKVTLLIILTVSAAVINEIIAVFLAKQAFKMSGEIKSSPKDNLEEVIN